MNFKENRKKIIAIVVIFVISLFLLTKIFQLRQSFVKKSNIVKASPVPTKIMPAPTTKQYVDESGFKFDYPENLEIASQEKVEQDVYSMLSLSAEKVKGGITIKITDTKLKKLSDFIKENKMSTKEAEIAEVDLGGLPASEIKNSKSVIVVAIDSGILYEVRVSFDKNKDFWTDSYKTILSTFTFEKEEEVQNEGASQDTEETSSEDVIEEEEAVE